MSSTEINGERLDERAKLRHAPWNPGGIAIISFFLTPLPGGILHALNYERLGLAALKRNALIINVLSVTCILLLVVRSELPSLVSIFINYTFAVHFQVSQEHLFQHHLSRGGRKASLTRPGCFSLISLIPVLLLIFGMNYYQQNREEVEFERAVQLMQGGELREAEEIFRSYQENYPEDTASYWNLAMIYAKLGETEKAKQELRMLLKQDPAAIDAEVFLQDLYSEEHNAIGKNEATEVEK